MRKTIRALASPVRRPRQEERSSRLHAMAAAHPPTWSGQLELDEDADRLAAPERDGPPYRRARLLVRAGGRPRGFVTVDLDAAGAIGAEDLRRAVAAQVPREALDADADLPEPPDPMLPSVTVVVCTRDRADSLGPTLRSLLASDYPRLEVVVVDNAPRTDATRHVIDELGDPRVRAALEPKPGLSRARNRGVAEASGEIVAFTDDDVVVDARWLRALVCGFRRHERVGCVTGLVAAAELETPAQQYFEQKVGWSEDFVPRLFDLEDNRVDIPLYPYVAGTFGAGANFALTRAALRSVGGFDEALGAGSPAKGGEDIDYFLRLILAGYAIAYEPAALVWHQHRRELAALRKQLDGYGSGLSAFLFKYLLKPRTTVDIVRRGVPGLKRMRDLRHRGRDGGADPMRLWRTELLGFAAGPARYLRGRLRSPSGRP